MLTHVPNELRAELLGVASLNPFMRAVSASRLAMFCNQVGQALPVFGVSRKTLITGVEREYAKGVCDIHAPCTMRILKIVERFPTRMGEHYIKECPLTTIIYENMDSPVRKVGCLHIPRFHSMHQYFGFRYRSVTGIDQLLYEDSVIPKGSVFVTSPSVTEDGDYRYGIELNVACMSDPYVIEDGAIVCSDVLPRLSTYGYGERTIQIGASGIPLNLFGDPNNPAEYKPCMHIGERIGPDGLIFATRRMDERNVITALSNKALRRHAFGDDTVYANPNAKIVDITVYKGNIEGSSQLQPQMQTFFNYYYDRQQLYHKAIVEEYRKRKTEFGKIEVDDEFNQTVVDSLAFVNNPEKRYLTSVLGKDNMDEWVIVIRFEYVIVPTIGFKITGSAGDKCIICQIRPREDMPRDADGHSADIMVDDMSTIKRTNKGRFYYQYITASAMKTRRRLKEMLERGDSYSQVMDYLLGFYGSISPDMELLTREAMTKGITTARKHIDSCIRDGIYILVKPDNPVNYIEVILKLRKDYPPCHGPVIYRDMSGELVETVKPVLIGTMYIMLLEKIGNTWQATSSSRRQQYGIPAKLSKSTKYLKPVRDQAQRFSGESESRLLADTAGGRATAELLDRTNNLDAHRMICEKKLTADKPFAIENIVDRNLIPLGRGRIWKWCKHVLACCGIKIINESHKDEYDDI